jgi:hypothetical protein
VSVVSKVCAVMASAEATIEETPGTRGEHGDAAGAPWEDAPTAGGILAGVFASFSERGFEMGYRRAVSDVIALLLLTAAEHRRDNPGDPRLRAVLDPFVDRLDRRLQRLSPTVLEELYGGLGI